MKILLLEDDLDLGKALCRSLELNRFKVIWLRTIESSLQKVNNKEINLILLDLSLPDGEGLQQLKEWRKAGVTLPIIIITARDKLDDITTGLDSGADDFLAKPFTVPELISRINAVYRRTIGHTTQLWTYGDLSIDPLSCTVTIKGKVSRLSRKEASIISELICNAGKVVPKSRLEEVIFDDAESNVLEVHIHNLRKKIGKRIINTIRGVGYSLNEEEV